MKKGARYFMVVAMAGLFFVGQSVFAVAGLANSPLWLSPASPKDGETTTLYAAFRNTDSDVVTGTVSFYDGQVLLAKKQITISSNQISVSSATFTMIPGTHSFSATLGSVTKVGSADTVAIDSATAKLPDQFISKKIPLSAQASGDADSAGNATILNQVDKAEKAVLAVVPEPTKNIVSSVATTIDNWRSTTGNSFNEKATEAKKVADAGGATKTFHANTVLGSKTVTVAESPTSGFTGPIAYTKYFFFHVLGYLLTTPILFYVLTLVLLYFILRFIARRIGRAISKKTDK